MNAIIKTYQSILIRFPITSQAIQTGLLMGTGDFIAQTVIEKRQSKNLDIVRTGQFTLVGTSFVGPSLMLWYGTLDKYLGNKGKIVAVKKVAFDQLLFAPVFIMLFMGVIGFAQGNTIITIQERIKNDYLDILTNNYKLWPAVQLLNFHLMPLQYQVASVQIVAILWNTYLSWKMNQKHS